MTSDNAGIHNRPEELLQKLIRFDTTNPPGGETECINFIKELLEAEGLETTIVARDPERPNLLARLKGQGTAAPFLMYGHADVVTTKGQDWTVPPFEGIIKDGFVWGRGALDMKGGLAMMISAFLKSKAEGFTPAGDVILCVVSDEEGGGDFGARFLADDHPDLFEGARYAIGEFGGFSMKVGKQKFFPIMISEKQICWIKVTVRGPAGHGSQIMRGGAMAKVGRMLTLLDEKRLPIHITPVAEMMIKGMAEALPQPKKMLLRKLLNPKWTDRLLGLLGANAAVFEPLLRHTVNANIISGGDKINVIPSEIVVELDGRLLPGFGPYDFIGELRELLGPEVELEVLRYDPCPGAPDMGLFNTLAGILKEASPGSVPLPFLMPGASDARFFSKLGIQTYGFLPMELPEDFEFAKSIHAADERIPVDSVKFGADAIFNLLQRLKD